jgi:alpha-N-arabinofuranosidase
MFHHLGRETFLAPVNWVDEWPVINAGELIEINMELNIQSNVIQNRKRDYKTNFREGIGCEWIYLRNPIESSYQTDENGLSLTGNAFSLSDEANPAFLGFRQKDLVSMVETDIAFAPLKNHEEAGISVFYKHDAHFDLYVAKQDNAVYLFLRKVNGDITHIETKLPLKNEKIKLRIKSDKTKYYFYTIIEDVEVFLGEAFTRFVSKEANTRGFTGTIYALYATGNGKTSSTEARFTRFFYEGKD